MHGISIAIITALAFFASAYSFSHPATERYIPIGESPGISNVKSYIGEIRSVQMTATESILLVEDTDQPIVITEDTKIYLDTGPRKTNKNGTAEDCQVGRKIEVYLHDDGTAYWVKISAP